MSNQPIRVPWVKDYLSDHLTILSGLNLLERGAYVSLRIIYLTNFDLFSDEKLLHSACGAHTKKERNVVRHVVQKLFTQMGSGDDFPFNEELNTLKEQALIGIKQKSQAGIKSGIARREKRTAVQTEKRTAVQTMLEPDLEKEKRERKREKKDPLKISELELKEKFLKIAEENKLGSEVIRRSWERWKVSREENPPANLEIDWRLWLMSERPSTITPPTQERLSPKDTFIQTLGRLNWRRSRASSDSSYRLSPGDEKIIKTYEATNGLVWWTSFKQHLAGPPKKMLTAGI